MDVLPTLLSVAGIVTENKFDGKDFSGILYSENQLEERPVFWRYRNQWAVRKGDWKYLKIKEKEYLYNLKTDVGEQNNLFNDEPLKVNELKTFLKEWESEMEKYQMKTE